MAGEVFAVCTFLRSGWERWVQPASLLPPALYVKSCAYIRSSWRLADGWIVSLTRSDSVSQRNDGLHSAVRLALSTRPLCQRTVSVTAGTTLTDAEELRCANTGLGQPWV